MLNLKYIKLNINLLYIMDYNITIFLAARVYYNILTVYKL